MQLSIHINQLTVSLASALAAGIDIAGIESLLGGGKAEQPAVPQIRLPSSEWIEEGGVFITTMPAEDGQPAYDLIVPINPDVDISKKFAWGGYGKTESGLGKLDGAANTKRLVASEIEHPAAEFCAGLTLNGKSDWYLASQREASAIAAIAPHLMAKEWHWTSTQYSEHDAFVQDFSDGTQLSYYKGNERRVLVVRRVIHSSL